jgi:AcrR family transcriptional regulator
LNEKERAIIESAIKRFAQKGFTSTSIQEIANDSGISKGAFYLHFKSKDALLLAILNYYFQTLSKRVSAIDELSLPPREKFITQIKVLLETLIEHKEFIIMQSREQAIPLNEEVKKIIYKMHQETHNFYQANLSNIYGNEIADYLWDLSFILEGMLQSYTKILFFNQETLDLASVASFLFNRIDNIVSALLKSNEKPIITETSMKEMLKRVNILFNTDHPNINDIISAMKQELEGIEDKEDYEVSLEVIENEITRDKPRAAVIQGMLSNFASLPQLKKYTDKIKVLYQL